VLGTAAALVISLYAFQKPFRVYRSMEAYDNIPLPADYQEKTEWVFARLMYPPHPNGMFSRPFGYGGSLNWREGGTSWSRSGGRLRFGLGIKQSARAFVS